MSFGGGSGGRRREKDLTLFGLWYKILYVDCPADGPSYIHPLGKLRWLWQDEQEAWPSKMACTSQALGDLTEWLPTVVNVDFE